MSRAHGLISVIRGYNIVGRREAGEDCKIANTQLYRRFLSVRRSVMPPVGPRVKNCRNVHLGILAYGGGFGVRMGFGRPCPLIRNNTLAQWPNVEVSMAKKNKYGNFSTHPDLSSSVELRCQNILTWHATSQCQLYPNQHIQELYQKTWNMSKSPSKFWMQNDPHTLPYLKCFQI